MFLSKFQPSPDPPGSCDFEDGLCNLRDVQRDDDFNWIRQKGHTPSIHTGPSTDHTLKTQEGLLLYFFSCIFVLKVKVMTIL